MARPPGRHTKAQRDSLTHSLAPVYISIHTYIHTQAAKDVFALLEARDPQQGPALSVLLSYFEIYGGRCQVRE